MLVCFAVYFFYFFFFSSRRRHTRCALVTGVQTCALPISSSNSWSWRSAERQLHELLEVIEVGIQQGVVEARRDAVDRPGNGIRLVAAHDEAADQIGRASCRERVCKYV